MMNDVELCNAIQKYMHSHGKWDMDTNVGVLEEIMAHFSLPHTKEMLFYNRDKELSVLQQYLKENGTDDDRIWIMNQISETIFPANICELSPRFVQTYSESNKAYKDGMYMICGGGFRKALEYLVYDYAVFKYPDKENEIQKKDLCGRINTYLSDAEDIRDLADAARKLGNDFTHIITKGNNDYSLENLMAFITLLASDISEIISPNDDVDYNVRMKAKKILNKTT